MVLPPPALPSVYLISRSKRWLVHEPAGQRAVIAAIIRHLGRSFAYPEPTFSNTSERNGGRTRRTWTAAIRSFRSANLRKKIQRGTRFPSPNPGFGFVIKWLRSSFFAYRDLSAWQAEVRPPGRLAGAASAGHASGAGPVRHSGPIIRHFGRISAAHAPPLTEL